MLKELILIQGPCYVENVFIGAEFLLLEERVSFKPFTSLIRAQELSKLIFQSNLLLETQHKGGQTLHWKS